MILLRQRIYGLTSDGGGTSSMDFYNTQKRQYESLGGQSKLGKSFIDWSKDQKVSGQGISNQTSNLDLDKSSYKASTLQALTKSPAELGKSGGGNFIIKDPSNIRNTGSYANVVAGQKSSENTSRDWIKKQQQQSFNYGQQSVGIKQGAINTWKNMGTLSKVATGAALVGGTMMIANNIRRRKEAEEEARRARYYGRYY